MAEAQTNSATQTLTLRQALELALPYVQKVADTAPTTNSRMGRKLQAQRDYRAIKALLDADEDDARAHPLPLAKMTDIGRVV
jgi:hypothetical protein